MVPVGQGHGGVNILSGSTGPAARSIGGRLASPQRAFGFFRRAVSEKASSPRLRRAVDWVNRHHRRALLRLSRNQAQRARDVLAAEGSRTEW